MSKIPPVRKELQLESIETNRPVSEGVLNDFGAQSNFINDFQTDNHRWVLNGSYSVATGITLYDGSISFFYNSQIVGVHFWNGKSGSSGVTEFDIIWKDVNDVVQGSIFSVTPKIANTSSDNSRGFSNLTTGTNFSPTGYTLPTFSKTTFLEGETLYMVLNGAMIEAQNSGISLHWKPIN